MAIDNEVTSNSNLSDWEDEFTIDELQLAFNELKFAYDKASLRNISIKNKISIKILSIIILIDLIYLETSFLKNVYWNLSFIIFNYPSGDKNYPSNKLKSMIEFNRFFIVLYLSNKI